MCSELILHDSDSIGNHLGRHKELTQKEYNERFIQRMKQGRAAKQNDTMKAKRRKVEVGGKDLLESAMMETLDLPSLDTSPFTSPVTASRRYSQSIQNLLKIEIQFSNLVFKFSFQRQIKV